MKVVLSIAGSDSSGGAGIQADLKTFEAHGVFGTSVITALTAQNTIGVRAIQPISGQFITAQLAAIFDDFEVSAIKIGMLANAEAIIAVADFLQQNRCPLVVLDPVMVATSGALLQEPDARIVLTQRLFPHVLLITPNRYEAELLAQVPPITTTYQQTEVTTQIFSRYKVGGVLVKGGHIDNPEPSDATDVLCFGGQIHCFTEPRVTMPTMHGAGCTLSSAIAANLALGLGVIEAVRAAKIYVTEAIRQAPPNLGRGAKPLRHNILH